MGEHQCDKGPELSQIQKAQAQQEVKLDRLLDNQVTLSNDLRQAIDRLTTVIEADIETRAAVEQLKKDREILFGMQRTDDARIENIERLVHEYRGAEVFARVGKMWDWYLTAKDCPKRVKTLYDAHLKEKGIMQFIPAAITLICGAIVIADRFF